MIYYKVFNNQKGEIATLMAIIAAVIMTVGAVAGSQAAKSGKYGLLQAGDTVCQENDASDTDPDLCNVQLTAEVYNDQNCNGTRDTTERRLGGMQVKVTRPHTTSATNPETKTTGSTSGSAAFLDIDFHGQSEQATVQMLSTTASVGGTTYTIQHCPGSPASQTFGPAQVGSLHNKYIAFGVQLVGAAPTPTPTTPAAINTPTPTTGVTPSATCTIQYQNSSGTPINTANINENVRVYFTAQASGTLRIIKGFRLITLGSNEQQDITNLFGSIWVNSFTGPTTTRSYSLQGSKTATLEVIYDESGTEKRASCSDTITIAGTVATPTVSANACNFTQAEPLSSGSLSDCSSQIPSCQIGTPTVTANLTCDNMTAVQMLAFSWTGTIGVDTIAYRWTVDDVSTGQIIAGDLSTGGINQIIGNSATYQIPNALRGDEFRVNVRRLGYNNGASQYCLSVAGTSTIGPSPCPSTPTPGSGTINGTIDIKANKNTYSVVEVSLEDSVTGAFLSHNFLSTSTSQNSKVDYTFPNLIAGRAYWVAIHITYDSKDYIHDVVNDCPGREAAGSRKCSVTATGTQNFNVSLPNPSAYLISSMCSRGQYLRLGTNLNKVITAGAINGVTAGLVTPRTMFQCIDACRLQGGC